MGRYMGIKDLTEKILEDYNDIFADIVNVLVFKGKQRIPSIKKTKPVSYTSRSGMSQNIG